MGWSRSGWSTSRSCSSEYPDIAEISIFVELAVFLGGIGGGMYDYIGYTGMMREKRWGMLGHTEVDSIAERPLRRCRRQGHAPPFDTGPRRTSPPVPGLVRGRHSST